MQFLENSDFEKFCSLAWLHCTSIVNMLLLQRNDTETLPPEHKPTTSESVTERVTYLHNTNAPGNVAIPDDHGIQTEENVAYNGQFEFIIYNT